MGNSRNHENYLLTLPVVAGGDLDLGFIFVEWGVVPVTVFVRVFGGFIAIFGPFLDFDAVCGADTGVDGWFLTGLSSFIILLIRVWCSGVKFFIKKNFLTLYYIHLG